MKPRLENLPEEVLRIIAVSLTCTAQQQHRQSSNQPLLNSHKDLLSLSLTCKRLFHMVYPILWSNVVLEEFSSPLSENTKIPPPSRTSKLASTSPTIHHLYNDSYSTFEDLSASSDTDYVFSDLESIQDESFEEEENGYCSLNTNDDTLPIETEPLNQNSLYRKQSSLNKDSKGVNDFFNYAGYDNGLFDLNSKHDSLTNGENGHAVCDHARSDHFNLHFNQSIIDPSSSASTSSSSQAFTTSFSQNEEIEVSQNENQPTIVPLSIITHDPTFGVVVPSINQQHGPMHNNKNIFLSDLSDNIKSCIPNHPNIQTTESSVDLDQNDSTSTSASSSSSSLFLEPLDNQQLSLPTEEEAFYNKSVASDYITSDKTYSSSLSSSLITNSGSSSSPSSSCPFPQYPIDAFRLLSCYYKGTLTDLCRESIRTLTLPLNSSENGIFSKYYNSSTHFLASSSFFPAPFPQLKLVNIMDSSENFDEDSSLQSEQSSVNDSPTPLFETQDDISDSEYEYEDTTPNSLRNTNSFSSTSDRCSHKRKSKVSLDNNLKQKPRISIKEQEKVAQFIKQISNAETFIKLYNTNWTTISYFSQYQLLSQIKSLNISIQFYEFPRLTLQQQRGTIVEADDVIPFICPSKEGLSFLGSCLKEMVNLESLILSDSYVSSSQLQFANNGDENGRNDDVNGIIPPPPAPLDVDFNSLPSLESISSSIQAEVKPLWSTAVGNLKNLKELMIPNSFCGFITLDLIPSTVQELTLNTFFPLLFKLNSNTTNSSASHSTTATDASSLLERRGLGASLNQISLNISHSAYNSAISSAGLPSPNSLNRFLNTNSSMSTSGNWACNITSLQVWTPQQVLNVNNPDALLQLQHNIPPPFADTDDEDIDDEDLEDDGLDDETEPMTPVATGEALNINNVDQILAGTINPQNHIEERGMFNEDEEEILLFNGNNRVHSPSSSRDAIFLQQLVTPLLNPNIAHLVLSSLPLPLLSKLPEQCPNLEVLVIENWDYYSFTPCITSTRSNEANAGVALRMDEDDRVPTLAPPPLHRTHMEEIEESLPNEEEVEFDVPSQQREIEEDESEVVLFNNLLVDLATKCSYSLRFLYLPIDPRTVYQSTIIYLLFLSVLVRQSSSYSKVYQKTNCSHLLCPSNNGEEEDEDESYELELFFKYPDNRSFHYADHYATTSTNEPHNMTKDMISNLYRYYTKLDSSVLLSSQPYTFEEFCQMMANVSPRITLLENLQGADLKKRHYPLFQMYNYLASSSSSGCSSNSFTESPSTPSTPSFKASAFMKTCCIYNASL